MEPSTNDFFRFANAGGSISSSGSETNVKFSRKDFRWFINNAIIDTNVWYFPNNPIKSLMPRHNAGTGLKYENDKWRVGLESYYTGLQFRSEASSTENFIQMGHLLQRHFKWGSPYINFENFTDRGQGRYSSEVSNSENQPIPEEIYAPTDGFVFSARAVIFPFGRKEHH